jgi:hypothetical protein
MSFPLTLVNRDLFDTVGITHKSSVTSGISDASFEQLLCYNLIRNVKPIDLSNSSLPAGVSPITGKSALSDIMINNNDDIIDSENMIMKFDYSVGSGAPSNFPGSTYSYAFAQGANDTIKLLPGSTSYINSCIAIDISINNDTVSTVDNYWNLDMSRNNGDLFFAAANSNINTPGESTYPMYFSEVTSPKYIFADGSYVNQLDGSTNQFIYGSLNNNNTLTGNGLTVSIDPSVNFVPADFTAYKIHQSVADTSMVVLNRQSQNVSVSNLPIANSSNGDITTPTVADFESLFNNDVTNVPILRRNKVQITVGDVPGYITTRINNSEQSVYAEFDGSQLADNVDLLAAGIVEGSGNMYIDLSNGSVYLFAQDTSSNINEIILSQNAEYIPANIVDNNANGTITIYTEAYDNRATIDSTTGGFYSSTVSVLYNCDELAEFNSVNNLQEEYVLDARVCIVPNVNFSGTVVVPTTNVAHLSDYYSSNSSNIANSNDTVIVSSDPSYNSSNYTDLQFTSTINTIDDLSNSIVFITIANKDVLSDSTQIVDNNGTTITNSISSISTNNLDLSFLQYDKYEVLLTNKTISGDLSSTLNPTNNWYLASTNENDLLTSKPGKTSVLSDDCFFMRSGIDTSFNYVFTTDTSVTNVQSVKNGVTISFNDVHPDPNNNNSPILVPVQVFIDDVSYSNLQYTEEDIPQTRDTDYIAAIKNTITDISTNYIKKIVRTTTFNMSLDPRLPFYTNVSLNSPTITKYITYYELLDINDNKLPDLYLKYYKDMSGNSLSLVDISQRGVEYSTTLTVTPNTCSTLKSGLYGFYVGNEENKVLLSNTLDTDPFFNTETILTLTSRGTVTVELEVQHTINAPYYIIPCVNKPGDQISFDSSLYKFNLSDPSHCAFLDENFNPYTTMWLPYENLDIRTPLLSNFSLNMGLTLYYNDSLIIDMSQANVINNDFNIIRCLNPLVRVDTTLYNLPNGGYLTAYRNYVSALTVNGNLNIKFADGVYVTTLYTLNPSIGDTISFSLDSDQYSVAFVDVSSNLNNSEDIRKSFISIDDVIYNYDINNVPTSVALTVHSSLNNNNERYTNSVTFDKFRGYMYTDTNSGHILGGTDVIIIQRTPVTANYTFISNNSGTFTQLVPAIGMNGSYDINSITNGSSVISISGFQLTSNYSLLDVPSSRIQIDVKAANINWSLIDISNITRSDYTTTLPNSLPNLFGWKPRNILSNKYTITITYLLPNPVISKYSGTVTDFLQGDPTGYSYTNMNYNGRLPDINTFMRGLKISQQTLTESQPEFTAYAVLTPPQLKLTYRNPGTTVNNSDINQPVDPSGVVSYYYITNMQYSSPISLGTLLGTVNGITLRQNNRMTITSAYNTPSVGTIGNTHKFKFFGNYVNIYYYLGSPEIDTGAPFYSPLTSNHLAVPSPSSNIIYSGTIDLLIGSHPSYPNFTASKNKFGYDISYVQQGTGVTGSPSPNIALNIGNSFISPTSQSGTYSGSGPWATNTTINYAIFDLTTSETTNTSFYQANVHLQDGSFVLLVDKYSTTGTNYSAATAGNLNAVFFVATSHSTCSFAIPGTSISNVGPNFNVEAIFSNILQNSITFVNDSTFTTPKNIGITLTAMTTSGINNLKNLLFYNFSTSLNSTANYINMPDIMRVKSLFGTPIFRITNNGNVKTPSVTTYSLNLTTPTQLYDASGSNSIMNYNNFEPNGQNNSYLNVDNIKNLFNTTPNVNF